MPERNGKYHNTIQQNGEYGNANVAILEDAFAADADDTTLVLGKLPGGSKIHRVTAITGDMGNAQTMDIGYRYIDSADGGTDDEDGFFDGIDTGSAAATNVFNGIVDIVEGCGVEIVALNIGDVATGDIDLIAEYQYLGQ